MYQNAGKYVLILLKKIGILKHGIYITFLKYLLYLNINR